MAQSRCSLAFIVAVALVCSVGLFDTVAAVDIFASVAIEFMVTVVVVVSCAHLKESASHPFQLSLQLDASGLFKMNSLGSKALKITKLIK